MIHHSSALLRCSSSPIFFTKKMGSNSDEPDRISSLPDELLHQILNLLDMKQVVQTSVLCKRWKYLWKSVCTLNFNQNRFWQNNSKGFKSFVDKVLLLRDHDSDIYKLSLCCDYHDKNVYVDQWINSAVTQHVQDLHLEGILLQRTIPFLGHVKTLNMRFVCICKDCKKFVFDLPFVENFILYLPRCSYLKTNLVVSAPHLKRLTVWNGHDAYGPWRDIEICAPNLAYLQLKGKMYEDYHVGNFASLEVAEIDLHFDEERMFAICVDKLLKELYTAKSLTLSAQYFQNFPDVIERLSVSLHNVKHLKLIKWRTYGPVGPMAMILKCCPNVETLVLRSVKVPYYIGREDNMEAQLSFQCLFGHLKTIEISDFKGCDNELKFLGFLIQNASVLEKVILRSTKVLPIAREEELVTFCKKLQSLFTASSKCAILLLAKKETGLTILFDESSIPSESSLDSSRNHTELG